MRYLKAFILFFFPAIISRILLKFNKNVIINKEAKIGFSIVLTDKIELSPKARIGHFNFISIEELKIKNAANIYRLNIIKGPIKLILGPKSIIKQFNKITKAYFPVTHDISVLKVESNSVLGMNTLFDLTNSMSIGNNCVFAGVATQLWSHGYYHFEDGKRVRVEGEIHIGDNNYIGSRCIIMPGIKTANNISIGANCVVSKSLETPGAYVSQGLRYLGKIETEKLNNFQKIEYDGMVEPIFKKKLD